MSALRKILSVWTSRPVELRSPLSVPECEARLQAVVDAAGWRGWRPGASRPVVGRVGGGTVRLHKRIDYRNSFQTFLTGSLAAAGAGTVFRGRAGPHAFVGVFMAVWLGMAVLISGPMLLVGLSGLLVRGEAPGLQAIPLLLVPLLLPVFGALLAIFGRWVARDEARFLIDFLAAAISAPPPWNHMAPP